MGHGCYLRKVALDHAKNCQKKLGKNGSEKRIKAVSREGWPSSFK